MINERNQSKRTVADKEQPRITLKPLPRLMNKEQIVMQTTNNGGKNIKPQKDKIKKYKAYLSKYSIERLKQIALNKKLKVTSKSDKASLIKSLVKCKFTVK